MASELQFSPSAGALAMQALAAAPRLTSRSGTRWARLLAPARRRTRPALTEIAVIDAIERGFDGASVEFAQNTLRLSQAELARLLDTTEKTVRALKTRKALDLTTSEKIFRLVKAFVAAYLVFESEGDAIGWLKEPSDALGGKVPLDLLTTAEGETLVHYELAQMEYGQPV